MKHIKLLSMDLQRFADDVDNPDVDETSKDEKIKDDEKQEKTFTRAELGKVIAAEKAKWEKDFEAKLEKEKSEAARLAKLSKDEREEEENKRIKAIEERERNVQLAELRIETKSELANSGLPESFVDFVLTEKAEDIQSNIANLKKHFDEELEKAVNLRLVQKQTKVGTGGGSLTKAQIMEIKDSRERQKAIAENRHLF